MKKIFILIYLICSINVFAQLPILQWAKHIGGTQTVFGQAIATDVQGNVYTTGYFTGATDFDPGSGIYALTAPTATNSSSMSEGIFISKVDVNGNFVWAKNVGGYSGINFNRGVSIAVDKMNSVYVCGYFSGTGDFDPGIGIYYLTGPGAFILKLDPLGNFAWVKHLSGSCKANSIVVNEYGNSFVTGTFYGSMAIGTPGLTYTLSGTGNNSNAFICRLDGLGNCLWTKQIEMSNGNSIVIDANYNSYITGSFSNSADFDPGPASFTLSPQQNGNIFILKLDAFGNYVFARNIGSSFQSNVSSIAVDHDQNIYTAGYFYQAADFDPGSDTFKLYSDSSSYDIFISKLNNQGDFAWAKRIGGPRNDQSTSMVTDSLGNVYLAGIFFGTSDFDPGPNTYTITSVGYRDMFISKLDAGGNFVFAGSSGVPTSQIINNGIFGITLDAQSAIYATGAYCSYMDFDLSSSTYFMPVAGNYDMFILKMLQNAVGLNENSNEEIPIYPNPVNDILKVQTLSNNEIINLQISDITGKIVYEENKHATYFDLDTKKMLPGFYTIKITTTHNILIRKIIKN